MPSSVKKNGQRVGGVSEAWGREEATEVLLRRGLEATSMLLRQWVGATLKKGVVIGRCKNDGSMREKT